MRSFRTEQHKAALSLLVGMSLLNAVSVTPACSQDIPQLRGSVSMDELAMKTIQKEIELAALNADFRTHYMQPNKWRNRRVKFYQMAAGGIANAGDITIMSHFWNYYRNPGAGLKHKGSLESGVITVMLAYLTLGSMCAAEGVHDLFNDYLAKRKGFDSKNVLKKAEALKAEIDQALSARKASVASDSGMSDSERSLLTQENKVLQDCRDLVLLEFSKLYVDARKKRIKRDVTTLGTIAVCATGAFPGALGVIRGIQDVNLKKIGGGGIGFLISGATLAGAPLLIHGGAQIGGAWTQKNLSKTLGALECKMAAQLKEDVDKLAAVRIDAAPTTTSARLASYRKLSELLAERQEYLADEKKRNKSQAIEDFVAYAIEGGPQIAWGSMVARAGYRWNRNPSKAFKLIAQGATVNEVSWGSWLLNQAQGEIRDELHNLKHRYDGSTGAFGKTNNKLNELKQFAYSPKVIGQK